MQTGKDRWRVSTAVSARKRALNRGVPGATLWRVRAECPLFSTDFRPTAFSLVDSVCRAWGANISWRRRSITSRATPGLVHRSVFCVHGASRIPLRPSSDSKWPPFSVGRDLAYRTPPSNEATVLSEGMKSPFQPSGFVIATENLGRIQLHLQCTFAV